MNTHGFVRVACAVPEVRLADCAANADRILDLMRCAQGEQVDVLVFPELCLTGYTCGDLFHQPVLQQAARAALGRLAQQSAAVFTGLAVVGLPLAIQDQVYNCAAVLKGGVILGIVPKTYLPNSREFYEARWFAPGSRLSCTSIDLGVRAQVPFGRDLLFDAGLDFPGLIIGVEICEDLWVPIPPSSLQSLAGATLLLNLSASNEVIGKPGYRRGLVANQSGRCLAGYVYACAGVQESTTDLVFAGHCLIAENGSIVAESERFQRGPRLLVTDVDLQRLQNERQKTTSFGQSQKLLLPRSSVSVEAGSFDNGAFRRIPFGWQAPTEPRRLRRLVDAHPFVPSRQESLRERCQDIFHAQVAGLTRRLEHIAQQSKQMPTLALGVSGGLDSTLALLVACKTLDLLAQPRAKLKALTMPGFGTSSQTLANAQALMRHLGVTAGEIDIRSLCLDEMLALGHRPFGIALTGRNVDALTAQLREVPAEKRSDLVFENIQARMRTTLLMNSGFVIGTGDLSELALGWCTYNGDHMSMYNPNVSIPKTLAKFLVRWAAENEFDGEVRRVLLSVVGTEFSPELLPTMGDGKVAQATESVIGPYELHDFFLFHFLRYGAPPEKILYLADHARFDRNYSAEEIRRWLGVFLQRFFANQFKRSCVPDGPKVGTVSLSPRGDWRMPSDAADDAWRAPE
jgi:NAD+ synthase (glutamine-hydrolysing)